MLFFHLKKHSRDRRVSLTASEWELVRDALLFVRNRAIREHIPTEDIDSLLIMLTR